MFTDSCHDVHVQKKEIIINSANENTIEPSKSKRKQSIPTKNSALPGEHRTIPHPGQSLPPASPTKCMPPFPPEAGYANNCDHDISSTTSLRTMEKAEITFLPKPHVNQHFVIWKFNLRTSKHKESKHTGWRRVSRLENTFVTKNSMILLLKQKT